MVRRARAKKTSGEAVDWTSLPCELILAIGALLNKDDLETAWSVCKAFRSELLSLAQRIKLLPSTLAVPSAGRQTRRATTQKQLQLDYSRLLAAISGQGAAAQLILSEQQWPSHAQLQLALQLVAQARRVQGLEVDVRQACRAFTSQQLNYLSTQLIPALVRVCKQDEADAAGHLVRLSLSCSTKVMKPADLAPLCTLTHLQSITYQGVTLNREQLQLHSVLTRLTALDLPLKIEPAEEAQHVFDALAPLKELRSLKLQVSRQYLHPNPKVTLPAFQHLTSLDLFDGRAILELHLMPETCEVLAHLATGQVKVPEEVSELPALTNLKVGSMPEIVEQEQAGAAGDAAQMDVGNIIAAAQAMFNALLDAVQQMQQLIAQAVDAAGQPEQLQQLAHVNGALAEAGVVIQAAAGAAGAVGGFQAAAAIAQLHHWMHVAEDALQEATAAQPVLPDGLQLAPGLVDGVEAAVNAAHAATAAADHALEQALQQMQPQEQDNAVPGMPLLRSLTVERQSYVDTKLPNLQRLQKVVQQLPSLSSLQVHGLSTISFPLGMNSAQAVAHTFYKPYAQVLAVLPAGMTQLALPYPSSEHWLHNVMHTEALAQLLHGMQRFTNLQVLQLDRLRCALHDSCWAPLSALKSLQQLHLCHSQLEALVHAPPALTCLRMLFHSCGPKGMEEDAARKAIKARKDRPQLLSLAMTQPDWLQLAAPLTAQLTALTLLDTRSQPRPPVGLGKLRELRQLSCDWWPGLPAELGKLSKLKQLAVRSLPMGGQQVLQVMPAVPQLQQLQLCTSRGNISLDVVNALGARWPHCRVEVMRMRGHMYGWW